MEFNARFKDPGYSNTKSWAKQKQARKYSTPRDLRKATPNGDTLNRADYWNDGYAQIESHSDINPMFGFLDINHQNMESNVLSLIENTNPTSITYQRFNRPNTPLRHALVDEMAKHRNIWSVYYRYTAEQQQEQIRMTAQREKALKRQQKESVKAKMLRSKSKHKTRRNKEYKPPNVEEPIIKYKSSEILFDERAKREYIQYDLGQNQWITAFSTRSQRRCNCYECTSTGKVVLRGLGEYKLYVAVDEEEREWRMYGLGDSEHGANSKRNKKGKHNSKFERSQCSTKIKSRWGKGQRNQKRKEVKCKKMQKTLKWQHVGRFNDLTSKLVLDENRPMWLDMVYRVNDTVYYDSNSNASLKKHFAKNGKLARWIKLVPCNETVYLNRLGLSRVGARVFGVGVDDYSQPLIPYNHHRDIRLDLVKSKATNQFNELNPEEITYQINRDDAGLIKRKNLQIGHPDIQVQDDEISKGKGCRLTVSQKRPMVAFHRKMDGVLDNRWGRRYGHVSGCDQSSFHIARCLDHHAKKRHADDWDKNGVPGKWEKHLGVHKYNPKRHGGNVQ